MRGHRIAGVAVAVLGLGLIVAPAASAAECGTPAKDAVYKTVTTPAVDPVYEDVEVVVVEGKDAVYEDKEVVDVEAKDAVYEDKKFIDVAAKDAVWQNFSPNKDQGPFEGPPAHPVDPRGTWQHVNKPIPPGQAGPDGVYQHGEGNGSWFYRAAAVEEVSHIEKVLVTPAVEEVSHIEKVLVTPAVEEVTEIVTILVTPGKDATTSKILVSEAVPAGEPCKQSPPKDDDTDTAVPVVNTDVPPTFDTELAYTGSNAWALSGIAALLLAAGATAYRLARRH